MALPAGIHQWTGAGNTQSLIAHLTGLQPNALPLLNRLRSPPLSPSTLILTTFAPGSAPEHPHAIAVFDRLTPDCLPLYLLSSIELYDAPTVESEIEKVALRQLLHILAYSHIVCPPTSQPTSCDQFNELSRTSSGNASASGEDVSLATSTHSHTADILRYSGRTRTEGELVVRDDINGLGGPYLKLAWRSPLPQDAPGENEAFELPNGMTWDTVRTDEDVAAVMRTNRLVRVRSQIDCRLNAAIRNPSTGKLVGWVFLGLDGSVRTLYVEPGFRRQGLAKKLVARLVAPATALQRETEGTGEGRWFHADVAEDNVESRNLFEIGFGAKPVQDSYWMRLDLAAASRVVDRMKSGR